MVERIAELVREKRIEGIGDLRDESDRTGMRVVIELKRDASAEVVLNQLYRFTPLQSSFAVNALALNRGRPEQMACARCSPPSSPSARRWWSAAPGTNFPRPRSRPRPGRPGHRCRQYR